jgi:hypothetical protein
MTRAIRLRRAFVAASILTAIIAAPSFSDPPDASASAMRTDTLHHHVLHAPKICPIPWRKGRRYVESLIGCAARYFGVSRHQALHVAFRESKFHPRAYNWRSCAKGIFQHLCRYWPERAAQYGFNGWSAFNARANIFVTMRMVRHYGWSPWGG